MSILDLLLRLASSTYPTFLLLFRHLDPRLLRAWGRARAERARIRALRRVPAYRRFVAGGGDETDKKSYIDAFAPEDRCVGGRVPFRDITVDESSGSTGTPYHWIRSRRERMETHRFIRYFTRYTFGSHPCFTINAFSMGAWATGLNMGQALEAWGPVKNTGPDLVKIAQTLKYFGAEREYLILGYPPFLKQLVDQAAALKLNLKRYRLRALVGGEGMSEGLRDYLKQSFREVYSGYGATDLEIGMAGETPASVALRRACRDLPDLKRQLFGEDSRLPMVFQFCPLMHWAEVNARGELVFTISRASILTPRVRYNIHDEGTVLGWDEVERVLRAYGLSWSLLGAKAGSLRLPFLAVFGRSDATMSVMGANLYPEDAEEAVYRHPELARTTLSFCQGVAEDAQGGVRPRYAFCVDDPSARGLSERYRNALVETLLERNADFRSAWAESPADLEPVIELWGRGQGPFSQDHAKIKQTRVLKGA